jgi:predicted neuraminidase
LRRSNRASLYLALGLATAAFLAGCRARSPAPLAVALVEDIFAEAPFAQCHASTVAETRDGLAAAWFGGTAEGNPDVGIWLGRLKRGTWTRPVEIVRGEGAGGSKQPCWNPVLFSPAKGPLLLFYKVGPSPASWRGLLVRSADGGRTWEAPAPLPDGILGPIKNHPLELPDGSLLCGSSTENAGWRVHFEMTRDEGRTWSRTVPINDGGTVGLIQPALLRTGGDGVLALMRSDAGFLYESRSADGGATWTPPAATALPNPNAGIDAVTLRDGRHVLVYNPLAQGRDVLAVALSNEGREWKRVLTLEDEAGAQFSYPAVIQTRDGRVHITYTWKRTRIRHAVFEPARR